jgi:hypothetical protein
VWKNTLEQPQGAHLAADVVIQACVGTQQCEQSSLCKLGLISSHHTQVQKCRNGSIQQLKDT